MYKNRGNMTAQEDDEEKDSNQEHNNRGLRGCVEPSSDENKHLDDEVVNGTSPRISHIISHSS